MMGGIFIIRGRVGGQWKIYVYTVGRANGWEAESMRAFGGGIALSSG